MAVVLVHGVADTYRVWDAVRANLDRDDVVAIALPGFDSPLPESFSATKEAYLDWLIRQIERIGRPVHLVGHDWGCILTARLASLRPDLVLTWAGSSGPVDPDYVWHELAKIWQAPGEGERWMEELNLRAFSDQLVSFGMPAEEAQRSVSYIDEIMKSCILRLYRSAAEVGQEWYPGLKRISAPGLVLWGLEDRALPHVFADRLGEATGAATIVKMRCSHWTILERPLQIARELEAHWAFFG